MVYRNIHRANLEANWDRRPGSGKLVILGRPTLEWGEAPEQFYTRVGFDLVHTIDFSPATGATHIHDLNKPLPPAWAGQYDLADCGGTLEHVYDIANALECLAALVKVGGEVRFEGPANNWMDHGFYQLSPTLKFDFFSANGWDLLTSIGTLNDPNSGVARFFPVYPGEAVRWNAARRRLTHVLVARRLARSTVDKAPVQSIYAGASARYRFEAFQPEEMRDGVSTAPPSARFDLADFRPLDGRWAAPFHDPGHLASIEKRPFRSSALVYEDGALLPWIVSDPAMVKERPGSFFHAARFVHFSTTDGSDPRSNGRRYEIAFPDLSGWL